MHLAVHAPAEKLWVGRHVTHQLEHAGSRVQYERGAGDFHVGRSNGYSGAGASIARAVPRAAHVVHGHDPRMIQPGGSFCFGPEPPPLGFTGQLAAEDGILLDLGQDLVPRARAHGEHGDHRTHAEDDAQQLVAIHDLNLAAAFCDRLYVLDHGRIVASGTPNEVLTVELLRTVFGVEALIDPHPLSGYPRITWITQP